MLAKGTRVVPTEAGKRAVKCLGDGRLGVVRGLSRDGSGVYVKRDGQISDQCYHHTFWRAVEVLASRGTDSEQA